MSPPERWSAQQYREWLAKAPDTANGGGRVVSPPQRAQPEYDEQVLFFAAVEWLADRHPDHRDELEDVFSTSSGGQRSARTAGRLKEAGQRRGVPDIECWVPKGEWHGLAIELKPTLSGRPTPAQTNRIRRLAARGYRARIIHGWIPALKELCEYLGLPFPSDPDTAAMEILGRRLLFRKLVRQQKRHPHDRHLPTP